MDEKKALFLEIFQPFAQYRNPFTFYYAQTYPLPPKSTIIGMLQNALDDWYGCSHGIEAWWNLKVSIHGGFESTFWNYQSLIKGDIELKRTNGRYVLFNQGRPIYGEGIKSQRSPVYQQELFNGHLYIFIKGEEQLIREIKVALKKPKKILYLGRSEDVIFLKNIKEITHYREEQLEGDIKLTYPTYLNANKLPIATQKYPVYSIPTRVTFKNNNKYIKHKSEITKSTQRCVDFTSVIYTRYDYSLILRENIKLNVEFYNIDDTKTKKEIRIISDYGWL
ncbi:MAG: type I-B CRISPR-associated protein Cas5b [Thermoplasmata archaeon]